MSFVASLPEELLDPDLVLPNRLRSKVSAL